MSYYEKAIEIAEKELQTIENIPFNELTEVDIECKEACERIIKTFSDRLRKKLLSE